MPYKNPGLITCPECGRDAPRGLGYRIHKANCEAQPDFKPLLGQVFLDYTELINSVSNIIVVSRYDIVSDGIYVRHANNNLTKFTTIDIDEGITITRIE